MLANILFVISCKFKSEIIGGHVLSAISFANQLQKNGHSVSMVSSLNIDLPELEGVEFKRYWAPYPGIMSRPVIINRILRRETFDVVITMDVVAAWHVMPAVILNSVPVIQIIPGGPVPRFPVIDLPGIIVFSRELYDGLPASQRISRDYIFQSEGRVDFEYFKREAVNDIIRDIGFNNNGIRLLMVTRLHLGKDLAVQKLFEQVRNAGKYNNINLVVVGDGTAKSKLEVQASDIVKSSVGKIQIQLPGGFRVTPADLKQADIVIGQGRTVVEAIASGIPAAVCGSSGYFGLITPKSLPILAETNLTGRDILNYGNLSDDIKNLEVHSKEEFESVQKIAYDIYDISRGAEAIEMTIEKVLDLYHKSHSQRMYIIKGYYKALISLFIWSFKKALREMKRFI